MTFEEYIKRNLTDVYGNPILYRQIKTNQKIIQNDFSLLHGAEPSENSKQVCSKISLTTACMARNLFLEKSLRTWMKLPFKEIIIVDWSSPNPVRSLVDKYQDGRIILIEVPDKKFYNASSARNVRVNPCNSDWILFVDSDIMLTKKFADGLELQENCLYSHGPFNRMDDGSIGTFIISKQDYLNAGGCNENLIGYGLEDCDLIFRLEQRGLRNIDIGSNTIFHIPHDDKLRNKYRAISKTSSLKVSLKTLKENKDTNFGSVAKKYTIYYPDGRIENVD